MDRNIYKILPCTPVIGTCSRNKKGKKKKAAGIGNRRQLAAGIDSPLSEAWILNYDNVVSLSQNLFSLPSSPLHPCYYLLSVT